MYLQYKVHLHGSDQRSYIVQDQLNLPLHSQTNC